MELRRGGMTLNENQKRLTPRRLECFVGGSIYYKAVSALSLAVD